MVILSLFSWWYSTGWLTLMRKAGGRVTAVLRFFSIPTLITSLFAPFRQISAGHVRGPLSVQMRAWGDRLFSRFMGAIVRLILIIVGVVALIFVGVGCLAAIAAWPLLPIAPLLIMVFLPGVLL